MTRQRALALVLAALGGAAFAVPPGADASPAADAPLRRLALVLGANSGGEGRVKLRYAASDARSFGSLLTELGGVRDEDLVLLIEPGLSSFRGAADRVRERAAAAKASGQRCEFVFYYSGHSDEEGLLLGKEKLGYSDLRAAIEKVPAAVRVAILDSCSSGSLTRAKGGQARPAFLFDASSDMEGHAYITSSSEAEAAQESDRIGGSFFTHYLMSALRGAADTHGEGRVTINEAYAYAFRETLASTENTQYGPQHPSYEISLTGSGDLVLTDLRSSRAGLALAEELSGSFFVRDAKGKLAVELDKASGERMEIGLPPGAYSVARVDGDARSQAEVSVPAGGRAYLVAANFRSMAPQLAAARGVQISPAVPAEAPAGIAEAPAGIAEAPSAGPDSASGAIEAPAWSRQRVRGVAGYPIAVDMSLLPDFSKGLFSSETDRSVSIGLLWAQARDAKGLQLASLANIDSGDMAGFQFAFLGNAVQGHSGGGQLSGLANVALGGSGGAQIATLLNYAGGPSGGLQLGLVNVADTMAGTQIGIVNVSNRMYGFPLGLVNIEKGGISMPQAWYESGTSVRLGYSLGTRIFYNLAQAGVDLEPDGAIRPSVGLGMGARLTVRRFYGDLDLSWREVFGIAGVSGPSARLSLRSCLGFPASEPGLFVGCALEGYMPTLSASDDGVRSSIFRVEPRFVAGVKL
jgi:hypothetical protein